MSVFDQNTNTNSQTNTNLFEDKLKEIVNENGEPKYKDVNTAIDALKASQEHIRRLEQEAADRVKALEELSAKAAKAETLEEIVARLTSNPSNDKPAPKTPETPVLSEDKIAELVANQLAKREQITQAQKNVNDVTTALTAKFGDVDKTKAAVAARAAELGMTAEKLGILSSSDPKLVLSLFGLANTPSSTPNPAPTSNYTSSNPQNNNELKRPDKSLLSGPGATDKNRQEFMKRIRDEVYKKYNVET